MPTGGSGGNRRASALTGRSADPSKNPAIALDHQEATLNKTALTVEPIVTPFLRDLGGQLMRRVDVIIRNPGRAGKAQISELGRGRPLVVVRDQPLPHGESRHTWYFNEVKAPTRMGV